MTNLLMKHYRLVIALISVLTISAVSCSKDNGGSVDGPIIKTVTSKFLNKAVYGCPLTINGENFSAQPGGNVVFFGDEKVTDQNFSILKEDFSNKDIVIRKGKKILKRIAIAFVKRKRHKKG